jgi:hypothetical protein
MPGSYSEARNKLKFTKICHSGGRRNPFGPYKIFLEGIKIFYAANAPSVDVWGCNEFQFITFLTAILKS